VFHDGAVVAYIQAFVHHDERRSAVYPFNAGRRSTVFEEGIAIPGQISAGRFAERAVFQSKHHRPPQHTRVPEMPRRPIST